MSHFNVAVFSRHRDDVDLLLEPYCENVEPGSEYAEFVEAKDGDYDEEMGKTGYWSNPNAKWDWYVEGGRWSGELKLKDGTECDSALVNECVFERDGDAYLHAIRFWEVNVEHLPLKPGETEEQFRDFYKPEYYSERYKTKENYAAHCADFGTYAFVTADGEWYGTGEMGWFGCDNATGESVVAYDKAFQDYMKKAKEDDLFITIVDCHI